MSSKSWTPFIEEHCKALGLKVTGKELLPLCDEFSQSLLEEKFSRPEKPYRAFPEPIRPDPRSSVPAAPTGGIFYLLQKLGVTSIGDIGCYTLGSAAPPLGDGHQHLHGGLRLGGTWLQRCPGEREPEQNRLGHRRLDLRPIRG